VRGGDRAVGVLGQAARGVEVSDEDVDPAAAQRRPDRPVLVRAAGHADAPGHLPEVGGRNAHHALIERSVEFGAVLVEEPQADVADRAGTAQLRLLGLGEGVTALPQQRRRLQAPDADQGDVSVLDALRQDWVRTLRSRGLPEYRVLFKHVLRNAGGPALSVLALSFVGLLGGAVIVEEVFGIPGLGQVSVSSTTQSDIPMVMGLVVAVGTIVILVNLVIDILQGFLNPKARLS
jgi:Binding-protein-dependent transport system inner membrane component